MEEILASIRRIIADDQPLPGAAAREAADEPAPAPESPVAEPLLTHDPQPAAQLDPMPPEHGAVAAPQFPSPRGTSGVMDTPHPLAPQASEPAAGTKVATTSVLDDAYEISAPEPEVHEDALRALHDEPSAREAVLGTDEVVEAQVHEAHVHEAHVRDDEIRELLEHKVQQAAAEEPPMSLKEPPAPPRDTPEDPAAGLLSASTSQSLAAAFNTLAISRLADNSDELRGMARDMLRPLLKDWLDANLPGLVETIIREEIDRMSRRGR